MFCQIKLKIKNGINHLQKDKAISAPTYALFNIKATFDIDE